jgi:hypothetical protein
MSGKGWISLHRSILDHWIWQDEKHFRWWITILLHVNHTPSKFPINGELFNCSPGESFKSIESWMSLFRCSKPTVLKFFELLENDGMITRKIVGKGNRRKHLLSVVNWAKFQQMETENFTRTKPETLPERNPNIPPNNNDNKKNNEISVLSKIQKEFYDSLIPFSHEFDKTTLREFYDYWSEPNKSKTKIRWQMEKTWDTKKRLSRWVNNGFKPDVKEEEKITYKVPQT